jgi:glutaredoxin
MREQLYTIETYGEISTGQKPEQVRNNVQTLGNFSEKYLDKIFSGQSILLKQDLDLATAQRYKRALDRTGLVCHIALQQKETITAQLPVNQIETVRCPKCGFDQPQEASCAACGIVFDKYLAQQQESRFYTPPPIETTTAQSRPSGMGWASKLMTAVVILAVAGYFGFFCRYKSASDTIVLYTADNCAGCDEAKAYFATKGVNYSEINIDASDENLEKFEDCDVGTLPLAFIGGERVVGFNQLAYGIAVDGLVGRQDGTLDKRIVMYSAPGCRGCNMARKFFKEHEITFEEYDINDPVHGAEYRSYAPIGTPLILVGGIRVDGFSQPALEMALRQVEQI